MTISKKMSAAPSARFFAQIGCWPAVGVGEAAHDPGAPADLLVQSLDMLSVRSLILWFAGNPGRRQAAVSPTPSRRRFAAALSLRSSISPATVPALAMADSRFSCVSD